MRVSGCACVHAYHAACHGARCTATLTAPGRSTSGVTLQPRAYPHASCGSIVCERRPPDNGPGACARMHPSWQACTRARPRAAAHAHLCERDGGALLAQPVLELGHGDGAAAVLVLRRAGPISNRMQYQSVDPRVSLEWGHSTCIIAQPWRLTCRPGQRVDRPLLASKVGAVNEGTSATCIGESQRTQRGLKNPLRDAACSTACNIYMYI